MKCHDRRTRGREEGNADVITPTWGTSKVGKVDEGQP